MVSISAAEASRLTGRSKQAIIKSINLGKISAVKDVDGAWQIEPVELFRHYPPASTMNGNGHSEVDERVQPTYAPSTEGLQVEVKMLRELLAAKEDVIAMQAGAIADLRQRLDQSQAQVSQLSAVIAQVQPPKAKPGWWQRLLGNTG